MCLRGLPVLLPNQDRTHLDALLEQGLHALDMPDVLLSIFERPLKDGVRPAKQSVDARFAVLLAAPMDLDGGAYYWRRITAWRARRSSNR